MEDIDPNYNNNMKCQWIAQNYQKSKTVRFDKENQGSTICCLKERYVRIICKNTLKGKA